MSVEIRVRIACDEPGCQEVVALRATTRQRAVRWAKGKGWCFHRPKGSFEKGPKVRCPGCVLARKAVARLEVICDAKLSPRCDRIAVSEAKTLATARKHLRQDGWTSSPKRKGEETIWTCPACQRVEQVPRPEAGEAASSRSSSSEHLHDLAVGQCWVFGETHYTVCGFNVDTVFLVSEQELRTWSISGVKLETLGIPTSVFERRATRGAKALDLPESAVIRGVVRPEAPHVGPVPPPRAAKTDTVAAGQCWGLDGDRWIVTKVHGFTAEVFPFDDLFAGHVPMFYVFAVANLQDHGRRLSYLDRPLNELAAFLSRVQPQGPTPRTGPPPPARDKPTPSSWWESFFGFGRTSSRSPPSTPPPPPLRPSPMLRPITDVQAEKIDTLLSIRRLAADQRGKPEGLSAEGRARDIMEKYQITEAMIRYREAEVDRMKRARL